MRTAGAVHSVAASLEASCIAAAGAGGPAELMVVVAPTRRVVGVSRTTAEHTRRLVVPGARLPTQTHIPQRRQIKAAITEVLIASSAAGPRLPRGTVGRPQRDVLDGLHPSMMPGRGTQPLEAIEAFSVPAPERERLARAPVVPDRARRSSFPS